MLVVIDGAVHNSEDEKISILFFKNERDDIVQGFMNNQDVYSSFPPGTDTKDVQKNIQILRDNIPVKEG